MTNMKRITCSFPDEMVSALDAERRTDQFSGHPYSSVIRYYLALGLGMEEAKENIKRGRPAKESAKEPEMEVS